MYHDFRDENNDSITDSIDRPKDFLTDLNKVTDITQNTLVRKKRDIKVTATNSSNVPDKLTKRSDHEDATDNVNDEVMEYIEFDDPSSEDENNEEEEDLEDSERGKRQIRFYLKNSFKQPEKHWQNSKPIKLLHFQQQNNYNPNVQNQRQVFNGEHNTNNQNPQFNSNHFFRAPNSYVPYQIDSNQNRPFKASIPDLNKQRNPQFNGGPQIITKSPPISSLNNNQNPFSALAGGFYNNALNIQNNQLQPVHSTKQTNLVSLTDSAHLSSAIVTGKPVQLQSSVRKPNSYTKNYVKNNNQASGGNQNGGDREVNKEDDYEEEDYDSSEEEDSSHEEENDQNYRIKFGRHYGSHNPSHKFTKIENPFANPDFDFDAFLDTFRDDHYSVIGVSTPNPKTKDEVIPSKINNNVMFTTASYSNRDLHSSTLKNGLNTPRPFTVSAEVASPTPSQRFVSSTPKQVQEYQQQLLPRPPTIPQQNVQKPVEVHNYNKIPQTTPVIQAGSSRPSIKPPNFKDDRQLPISYSFNVPNENIQQIHAIRQPTYAQSTPTVTQKPYLTGSGTAPPTGFLIPNNHKQVSPRPQISPSTTSNFVSTIQPHNAHPLLAFIQSTLKPSTPKPTDSIDEQLAAFQNYWKTLTTGVTLPTTLLVEPVSATRIPKNGNLYSQILQSSTPLPVNSKNKVLTTTLPPKRRPIPKPSPEMNDYYYDDDDDQYYYEPAVKPKYMPSSEVKPQRPKMAQNFKEYNDLYDDVKQFIHSTPKPGAPNTFKQDSVTKNHNDLSVVTKIPYKQQIKNNISGKIPVPVMVDYVNPSNAQYVPRNKTLHIRKPVHNANTLRPPKYLNQTTLRPYTVRHRLAKPTTETFRGANEDKQAKGITRHQNIVAQNMKTTPRDSYKQETRVTKTNHDDRTNR